MALDSASGLTGSLSSMTTQGTTRRGTRATDSKALASLTLAIIAACIASLWIIATVIAIAAISLALASRRSLRANPALLGTTPSVLGFLIASGVLLFATLGPVVLNMFLLALGSLAT